MRAAIFTPVRPSDAFLARLSDDGGLPIPLVGRLSRLIFSRPRRCSLLLRPAWPADPQKGPFPEVLQMGWTAPNGIDVPECGSFEPAKGAARHDH
jgi:hypothetical protein